MHTTYIRKGVHTYTCNAVTACVMEVVCNLRETPFHTCTHITYCNNTKTTTEYAETFALPRDILIHNYLRVGRCITVYILFYFCLFTVKVFVHQSGGHLCEGGLCT